MSSLDHFPPRSGDEIRKAFLTFFANRSHKVIPSASLIPDDPTVLLTIAGMLPFKKVFLGQETPPATRATTSQKCIRTNDIENVGRTARHQTFFEMLGNFSFGDYFKKEAIQWAWELSTDVFGLDPRHLVVSVFKEDDEAEAIWRDVVGVNPRRIIRLGEDDNFWASGPTGPCGPCSELYYDFKPEFGDNEIDLEDDKRFIEFYNLVFMQYSRDANGTLSPLATCNIDTGMGLERMAQILQGTSNNYETDLIFPLIQKASSLAGVEYEKLGEKEKTSLKIIGDHSRAITQLIADGVISNNLGRGYVLRRLIRRVVRHGRLVGIAMPFLREMGAAAIQLMQSVFPELAQRREMILQELVTEEARFLETLEKGEKLLEDLISTGITEITGDKAFELYDTYGFPLELTEEIAKENDLKVDIFGFEESMKAQRLRAKAASSKIDLTLQESIDRIANEVGPTEFFGYDLLEQTSSIQALVVNGESSHECVQGDNIQLVLDRTCFYGEGGGQIGDCGVIRDGSSDNHNDCLIEIEGVTRNKNVFVHVGRVLKGTLQVGDKVVCQVDKTARRRAQANHTATHLLQSALQKVVDPGITQAGSLVSFERLRFDFNSPRSIPPGELHQIETLINTWISESHPLHTVEMDIDKAKNEGAIAMFGEKYDQWVRVVDVPGVSKELCGGTHVANTAEIGVFKVISEIGIASGVRRIEAIAGPCVLDFLNERDLVVKSLSDRFKAQPEEILGRVLALQNEVKMLSHSLKIAQQDVALAKVSALSGKAKSIGDKKYLIERLDFLEGEVLQFAAQNLVEQLGKDSAVVLGGTPDRNDLNKVVFVAAFGSGLVQSGLTAGKFIGPIAKICGGGGGGRPNLAQAGGRDSTQLDNALHAAAENLLEALK